MHRRQLLGLCQAAPDASRHALLGHWPVHWQRRVLSPPRTSLSSYVGLSQNPTPVGVSSQMACFPAQVRALGALYVYTSIQGRIIETLAGLWETPTDDLHPLRTNRPPEPLAAARKINNNLLGCPLRDVGTGTGTGTGPGAAAGTKRMFQRLTACLLCERTGPTGQTTCHLTSPHPIHTHHHHHHHPHHHHHHTKPRSLLVPLFICPPPPSAHTRSCMCV